MQILRDVHPDHYKKMTTDELRNNFLIENLFKAGELTMIYVQADRMMVGSAVPTDKPLVLEGGAELASQYFLERREMGIINVGQTGTVLADGTSYVLNYKEALYLGRGVKEVSFTSHNADLPAQFYINSAPAHRSCPIKHITLDVAKKVPAGSQKEGNKRIINQLIHPAVVETCQLTMGLTELEEGSLWNTMPTHTHDRRMEVYLYLNVPKDSVIFHMMGEPNQIKTLVMRDRQAVFSPSWSIHSGVGTQAYSFIWGMVGENQEFTDMDFARFEDLK